MDYETYRIADLIDEIAMGPFGSNIKVSCFVDSGVPVSYTHLTLPTNSLV